jgi:hypothetical protein
VTKPAWSSIQPFVRPVPFTPLICLDTLHPSLVPLHPPPAFLAIPAASQPALATQVIRHAQVLSSTHGVPAIVCSRGASAVIDETGQIMYRQNGGKGFIATLAIPWSGDNEYRGHTWAETLGPVEVLACFAIVIAGAKVGEVCHRDGASKLIEGVKDSVDRMRREPLKIKRPLTWRDPAGVGEDQGERRPLLDQDESSGRASAIPVLEPMRRIVDLMSAA